MRACLWCGKDFDERAHSKTGATRYCCSEECSRKRHQRGNSLRRAGINLPPVRLPRPEAPRFFEAPLPERTCDVCGARFAPRHGRQKRCSLPCTREARARAIRTQREREPEKVRERQRRYDEARKATRTPRPPPMTQEEVEDAIHELRTRREERQRHLDDLRYMARLAGGGT